MISPTTDPNGNASRRKFFGMAVGGAVAGSGVAIEFVAPSSALAQSTLTPGMALKELLVGNRRFQAGNLTSFELDLAILRNHTSEKQQPFAAVLACADSRVPVELIFDQSIGQIFVTRNAGNITTSEIIASLEYGADSAGVKGDPRDGTWVLRCGGCHDSSQRSSWADQCALSAYPARG